MIGILLAVAIQLSGVTGGNLRARAFFDVNNVQVGDPLVLTIDFIGQADFQDIHPPALSRAVNRRDWKVDDVSAKTDTFNDARRLTYRVRPLREGVLWFPSLEFGYTASDGTARTVRANEIPVHAKVGEQVVVTDEMKAEAAPTEAPRLELIPQAPEDLSDDQMFAWRKALANPSADAFAAFDFPAAKLNEATQAVADGNWARAMTVYSSLEWQIGQTPEIERGIIAALALKTGNPAMELPVWRQVLRPLLRFGWKGRVGIVLGVVFGLVLLGWLLGRGIRAIAVVVIVLLSVLPAAAKTVETVTTNADGSVTTTKIVHQGGMTFQSTSTVGGTGGAGGFRQPDFFEMMSDFDPFARRAAKTRPRVEIQANLVASRPTVTVGEPFDLVLSIEHPAFVALSEAPRILLGEQDFLAMVGTGRVLSPVRAANPTNVIQRFVYPVRANVFFTGPLHYAVAGEYVFSNEHPIFRTPKAFESGSKTTPLEVKALPTEGRPSDFSGLLATRVDIFEVCDRLRVETNDVITIVYRMKVVDAYVPTDFLPRDVAFEWVRRNNAFGQVDEIEYRRYFVADGAPETPKISVPYYDPKTRSYRMAKTGGTTLKYGIIDGNESKGQR